MNNENATEQVLVDTESNRVDVLVDRNLYPLDAIYGAAYVFIDRCFLLLDSPDAATVKVSLTGRERLEAGRLWSLAGEFGNELLAQVWRRRVVEQNQPVIEAVAARALANAAATSPVEGLDDLDLSEDAFDDPLGIAVPWEEKYGQQTGRESETNANEAAGSDGKKTEEE